MSRERRSSGGALPEVELAILESDVHHLRDQNDRDRRAMGERMNELRQWRDRIELAQATQTAQLARAADSLERLDVARKADAMQLAELVGLANKARGAYWVVAGVAGFAGLGTLLQIARFILEAVR